MIAPTHRTDTPNRLVIRRVNEPVTATFDYRLTPEMDSTAVSLHAELVAEQALRVVGPLLGRALARTDRDQMDRLLRLGEEPREPSSRTGRSFRSSHR